MSVIFTLDPPANEEAKYSHNDLERVNEKIQQQPNIPEHHLLKAEICIVLKKHKEAIEACDVGLRYSDSSTMGGILMTKAYAHGGISEYKEALGCLESAKQFTDINDIHATKQLFFREGLISALYAQRLMHIDIQQAKFMIDKAIKIVCTHKLDHSLAMVFFIGGNIYYELNDDTAILLHLFAAQHGVSTSYMRLGASLYRFKEYEAALDVFERHLQNATGDFEIYHNMAMCSVSLGRVYPAYKSFLKLKEIQYKKCFYGPFGYVLDTDPEAKRVYKFCAAPEPYRLEREVNHLIKCRSSPNTCKYINHIGPQQEERDYYQVIVVEKVDTILNQYKIENLSIPQLGCLITGLLRGLSAIHSENIVHCDISTRNIGFNNSLQTADDVRIIDFGASVNIGENCDHYTKEFACPEIRTKPAHPRFDIFSVGVLLHDCLLQATAHLEEQPTTHPMLHIISKATAKPRKERYQSASEMLQAFEIAWDGVMQTYNTGTLARFEKRKIIKAH
jgi:tetratricopeptide (TPR) repeat protein